MDRSSPLSSRVAPSQPATATLKEPDLPAAGVLDNAAGSAASGATAAVGHASSKFLEGNSIVGKVISGLKSITLEEPQPAGWGVAPSQPATACLPLSLPTLSRPTPSAAAASIGPDTWQNPATLFQTPGSRLHDARIEVRRLEEHAARADPGCSVTLQNGIQDASVNGHDVVWYPKDVSGNPKGSNPAAQSAKRAHVEAMETNQAERNACNPCVVRKGNKNRRTHPGTQIDVSCLAATSKCAAYGYNGQGLEAKYSHKQCHCCGEEFPTGLAKALDWCHTCYHPHCDDCRMDGEDFPCWKCAQLPVYPDDASNSTKQPPFINFFQHHSDRKLLIQQHVNTKLVTLRNEVRRNTPLRKVAWGQSGWGGNSISIRQPAQSSDNASAMHTMAFEPETGDKGEEKTPNQHHKTPHTTHSTDPNPDTQLNPFKLMSDAVLAPNTVVALNPWASLEPKAIPASYVMAKVDNFGQGTSGTDSVTKAPQAPLFDYTKKGGPPPPTGCSKHWSSH